MSEYKPTEKPTMELPKVPDWAIELSRSVKTGLAKLETDIEVLIEDGRRSNTRLTRLEERIDELDGRLMRNSARVREPSTHDLQAQAELAAEKSAREALTVRLDAQDAVLAHQNQELAQQTAMIIDARDMLGKLSAGASKVFANPLFRSIVTALGAAFLTWLTGRMH